MQEIVWYLVGQDGKGGVLEKILSALKKRDEKNALAGNPTRYFETFTRTVRDFSPDISRRIDMFSESFESQTQNLESAEAIYDKAFLKTAIPDGAKVERSGTNRLSAHLSDGSEVIIEKRGKAFVRTIDMQGANFAIPTDMPMPDLSKAMNGYDAIRQKLSPQIARSETAIAFLNAPEN